jgi:hypothetical protein
MAVETRRLTAKGNDEEETSVLGRQEAFTAALCALGICQHKVDPVQVESDTS